MSRKNLPQMRGGAEVLADGHRKPLPFRALMTKERNGVLERLQLFGDFPECGPNYACDLDWMHVVMLAMADAAEHVRMESHEPDPRQVKAIKRQLAIAASACEMWSDSLKES